MYKCLHYLKVDGVYLDKGKETDLKNLSSEEISRLIKTGVVSKVAATNEISFELPDDDKNVVLDGELTEEQVRQELLNKIPHAVAVKELEILGASFRKNASLENLVELILANEEYENHFMDYIDDNEL
ncbi:hypothetical protein BN1050_02639 [Metalysinibacillus saudimassiliensis]|uniref:Uncharacterized protein n=1 Tax=Metalysinibacillus saudimassiliensis TaxID=1461583 RepID=A0A078MEK4_9BACL|nr:hypothetical protein BN1050_02639 [Metalysinibacillus saudimassiliensis]